MPSAAYNDAAFRQQFPAYASTSCYPQAALAFAWGLASAWLNPCQACWGIRNAARLQMAMDLMAAVVVRQLYGPGQQQGGGQNASQDGQAAGPVQSATEGSVTATLQLPEFGSSAFRAMLLANPPYGTMLLSLLQIAAGPSPYIPSGRFARVPP